MEQTEKKQHICMALLAHVDAGKTTLSEALLYTAGKIRSLGRVDNGDAYLDTHPLEKERGITIFSKQAVWENGDRIITLLDTPGHTDFSAEMERTLQVLDYAVLIVSGADGVQGHTETLWRLLKKYQVPVFLFVNKMDQQGADRKRIWEELRTRFGDSVVDFTDTESAEFSESIALTDENVLNRYLEEGVLEPSLIPVLIRQRKVIPCFFGSALKMEGIRELSDALEKYTESPSYPAETGAKVFKIARDDQGNRLTYVKVTGGVLKPRMEIADSRNTWMEKINQIRIYSGGRYETAEEAQAGMVCALTGLSMTRPGEGIGCEMPSMGPTLEPILTYRLILPDGCEAAVILPKLRMLEEEEPELHIVWEEELQEIQVQVMGEVQIEVLQRLIADRFGITVQFDSGNIVYKETLAAPVLGVGHFEPLRHYAEVHLWMEPGEEGSGFVADTACSEDVLDKNWQRLIYTHLMEKEHRGVQAGAPLTDVHITLVAGRAHKKHTEGGDFRQAAYRAIRQGLMEAGTILLEPYYDFRLEIPETAVGRAMTDLERMSGSFQLMQDGAGTAVLTGTVPAVCMRNYSGEVNAYTKGCGRLSCMPSGYRPCHNAEEVIREKGYDPERDTENPSGSVFCAHGAGFTVNWKEVKAHAHLPLFKRADETAEDGDEKETKTKTAAQEEWIGIEEIDEILRRTSHANQKGARGSHKGISAARVRELTPKAQGLSRPRKKTEKNDRYLLVDGYNIIFSWEDLSALAAENIDAARGKLMDILCDYQGFCGCRVILVFDAYRVQNHRTETFLCHNIQVVYTREAETADHYIEKFAHENAGRFHITVATSDGLEQIIIRGEGCRLLSAADLEAEIRRSKEEMRQYMEPLDN